MARQSIANKYLSLETRRRISDDVQSRSVVMASAKNKAPKKHINIMVELAEEGRRVAREKEATDNAAIAAAHAAGVISGAIQAARIEGVASERARLMGIIAIAPKHPKFVLDQYRAGATAETAKVAFATYQEGVKALAAVKVARITRFA